MTFITSSYSTRMHVLLRGGRYHDIVREEAGSFGQADFWHNKQSLYVKIDTGGQEL